jgi:hypothetical protein
MRRKQQQKATQAPRVYKVGEVLNITPTMAQILMARNEGLTLKQTYITEFTVVTAGEQS